MKVFVVLVLCAVGAFAVPTRFRREEPVQQALETCATQCSGAETKFKYAPGKAYEYDLKSETKVQLGGNQAQTTVVQTATVTINVQSPCELSMKLSNVKLTGADVPSTWASNLEKLPLRFSFEDGMVSNVCPQADEETWSLNIKRAILSTFQNALEGQDNEGFEVDVSGRCPTEYENTVNGDSVSIKRSKNLAACRENHFQHGAVRSMPYDVRSQLQNTPLLDSEQKCEHTIKNRVLQQATCTEKHTFQPFTKQASESSAIYAEVQQTLKFKSEKSADSSAFPTFEEQQSIHFDHSEFATELNENAQQGAKQSIERLCQSSADEVRPETPGLFAELVYDVRRLNEQELKAVYESAKSSACKQSVRFFMDALPMCGTEQCVGLMVELVTSNAVDQTAELEWYTSLAFVSRPNAKVLKAILPLMDRVPAAGLLGISSMAHSYCRHNRRCGNSVDLKNLVKKIEMRLGESCAAKTETEIQEIVYALKALGNIGNDESVVPTLVRCFSSKVNPIEIQLAAVRALRRQSCDAEQTQPLLKIYKTVSEQAELRIVAFTELMRCPTSELIDEVKEQLEKETINQVGSYVFSFLTEKRRSTDPAQRELASLLLRHHFDQKWNRDPRRFSRYSEIGFLNEKSNVGAHAQSSVIFSPEGYLPRQASLNLTVHLFGRSVNFLEIGARSEGLEELMDSLTGPDGYFTNPNGYLFREKSAEHKNSRVRSLHDLYKKRNVVRDNDHLAASTYVKIFGDEIAYYGFADYNVIDQIKEMLDVEKLLQKMATERDITFNRNVVFLETTMTIPTASGLPLRLAVNGTAAINFHVKGKADLTKIMQAPFEFDINAIVKPSAAVEIAAMLGIQTGGVRQGVKMVARMHTSTNFAGQIQFREGRLYNAKISLPDDQMELLDVQSEMFQVINNRYQEHPEHRAGAVKKVCTPQMIGDITGLKVCGQAQIGSKALPYPFRATVTLEKADPTLESYDFMVHSETTGEGRTLKVGFNTPGSTIDRQMEAAFDFQPQRGEVSVNLRTPFKQIDIEGQLKGINEQTNNYEAKVKMTTDKKDVYEMEGTFTSENAGNMLKYALSAAAKANEGSPAKLESAFEFDTATHRSAKMSLNVDNVFTKPVNFKTELVLLEAAQSESNFPKYVGKIEYNGPDMEAKVDSHLEKRGGLDYDAKFEVEYTKAGGKKHNFLAQGSQTWKRSTRDYKLTQLAKFETSLLPNAKLEVDFKAERNGQKWNNELQMTRGAQKSRYVVNAEKRENNLFYTTLEAKCDTLRFDHKAIVQYQNNVPSQFLAKVELDTPKTKGMLAEITVDTTMNPKWALESSATLKYPGRELKFQKSVTEKSEGNYKMHTEVQWAEGKKIEIDSDMVMKSTEAETEYTVEGTAKIAGQKEPLHIRKHYKTDNSQSTYHWWARRGNEVVYDVRYNIEGELPEKKTISAHAKSQVIAQFDYEFNGDINPTDKVIEINAIVKNNGKDFGKIEAIVPKTNSQDNKQIKGLVSWDLDTETPKELSGEWKKTTEGKNRIHDFTFNGQSHGERYMLNAKVEKGDYYKMNATIEKANKPLVSINFGLKDPRSDYSRIAADIGFKSYEPLQKHDLSTLFLASFQRDNFMVKAEADCKEMKARWLVNAEGSSKPEGSDKLYKLALDIESPFHEIHVIQQAKGKHIIEATKATSNIQLVWAGRAKKIEHVVDIERSHTGIKGSSTTKTPFQSLSEVKETYEYNVAHGVFNFNHQLEWNSNKKVAVEIKGKNKDQEIGLDAKLSTSFETAKKLNFVADCQKTEGYWNCKSNANVNDKYKLSAYQEQADNRQKLGFDADLAEITKSDGHYIANIDSAAHKYNVELQLKKDANLYKVAAELNGQKETGMIKVQTPLNEMKTAKVTVTKTGDNEYEIKTERNGETEGTVVGQVRFEDQNQRIRLQFNDVATPFEFLAQNIKDATKQNAKFEVTVDPKGEKRTYGAEAEYKMDGERMTNARFVLTHPRRQMFVEMDRQSDEKIVLQLQPNAGTNRAPTKLELVYKEQHKGLRCEVKLTDPSLKQPLHCKFEKVQNGPCTEDENCELIFTADVDYSGEPEKVLKQKLRLWRSYESAAKNVKRRSIDTTGKVQKLGFEHTTEHPATHLHIKLWSKVDRLETEQFAIPTTVDTGIEFKNKNKQLVQYSTVFDYRPTAHKPSAFVRLNTPETWVKIEARTDVDKKEVNVYLYQNDAEPKIVVTLTVNPEAKIAQLEARTNEDSEVLLHASARMVDAYTAAVKVWHTEAGRRQDDADIKVQLDRSDLLKTKLFIRPALNRDLIKKAGELQTSVQNVQRSNVVRESLQSLTASQKLMLEDFARNMQPMMEGWAEEQRTLAEEMGAGYQELLDNIEIYTQLTKEIVWACLDLINQAIEQIAAELPNPAVGEYYRQLKDWTAELPSKTVQFLEPARDSLRVVGEQMNHMQTKLSRAYDNALEQFNLESIRDWIREFCDKLMADNNIMSTIFEQLKQWSESLSLDNLREHFDDMQKQYNEYKSSTSEYLNQFKDQFMDYAAASGLTHIVQPMVEPITNLDVESKAKDFIKYVRGMLSGNDTVKQYWQQYAPHITVNEPEQGRFEMEIPLPVKATSLKDLVEQVHPERLNAIKQEIKAKWASSQSNTVSEDDEELGYSVWDTIHKFKPASWNIRDQIPPFKSTAYLIGNQHIVTFDGHVFDFNAGCEYLLARDFHDGKFTITAAFERVQDQTVLTQIRTEFAGHQITLHRTGKIDVDGKAQQLPWQKVDSLDSDVIVKVERRDHSTVLTTYDGIEVACDAYYHVCQVTLPGRYHSKSSGLLGSNDNEPLNDLELADGTDNNDVNAMASQWSVNGDCKVNQADTAAADSTNNDCRNMFKSGASVLRPCFSQVAPGPFHQMCLRDMSRHIKGSDKHFEGLCNVTAAYLQACRRVGVVLTAPEQCVRCQSPEGNGQFVSGEEVRVTESARMKSSDVVFVVEERLCLKEKKQDIEKIAHQIATKDSHTRFGWVGFGGDGVHYEPHLHTDKDSTHFDAAAMRTMVNEMKFDPESGMEKEQTDPMRAVMYAVEHYAFRTGVQKTIVLVTCQLCDHRTIDHHTLQGALLNQGIVMHVITTEEIKASDSDSLAGFDAQTLFGMNGQTVGDRANLERPNDVCAVIAQETYGTVFTVSAIHTAATKIVEKTEMAREKNTCQICQCETFEQAPRTVCTPCDIVQPASLNSRSFTGIADFFRQREAFLL